MGDKKTDRQNLGKKDSGAVQSKNVFCEFRVILDFSLEKSATISGTENVCSIFLSKTVLTSPKNWTLTYHEKSCT